MELLHAPPTDEAYTTAYAVAVLLVAKMREYTKEEPAPQPKR